MADKGIIFSAPMVRALLEGRKTQTRRLLRNPEYYGCPTGDCPHEKQAECDAAMAALAADRKVTGYAVGDRLYVREAFSYAEQLAETVWYWADGNFAAFDCSKPKPSIHMPRWASRLWLSVTDVRVQRLQDISEGDAICEGIDEAAISHFHSPIKAYAGLWNHLHGAENDDSWEANPWIAAISFEVHHGNIDRSAAHG